MDFVSIMMAHTERIEFFGTGTAKPVLQGVIPYTIQEWLPDSQIKWDVSMKGSWYLSSLRMVPDCFWIVPLLIRWNWRTKKVEECFTYSLKTILRLLWYLYNFILKSPILPDKWSNHSQTVQRIISTCEIICQTMS